jgi:hypothetical protein
MEVNLHPAAAECLLLLGAVIDWRVPVLGTSLAGEEESSFAQYLSVLM